MSESDNVSESRNIEISNISNSEIKVGNIVSGDVTGDIIGRDKVTYNKYYSQSEKEELHQFLLLAFSTYSNYVRGLLKPSLTTKPYPFLQPFNIKQHHLFFGRTHVARDIFSYILRNPLTILHGRSGSGKSSLINAGLGPLLVKELDILPIFARAHRDPISSIIGELVKKAPSLIQPPLLAKVPLSKVLELLIKNSYSERVVILIDQFEEIFSEEIPVEKRIIFFKAISDCLEDKSLQIHFVLSIQSQFIGDLDIFRDHISAPILGNTYPLPPLSQDGLRDAIVEPLKRTREQITFEPELITELVDTLGEANADLTALQIVCTNLYEEAQKCDNQFIDTNFYSQRLGGLDGILEKYLDNALEHLDSHEKRLTEQIMKVLVKSDGQRKLVTIEEIVKSIPETFEFTMKDIAYVIETMVSRRLIQTPEDNKQIYELSHDKLAQKILQWLSPIQLEVKRVEEILRRTMENWHHLRKLMEPEELNPIYEQYLNHNVQLTAEEFTVALLSKFKDSGYMLDFNLLDAKTRQQIYANLVEISNESYADVSKGRYDSGVGTIHGFLAELVNTLIESQRLSLDAIRHICSRLDFVDYDSLPGEVIDEKLLWIVEAAARFGEIYRLIQMVQQLAPGILEDDNWGKKSDELLHLHISFKEHGELQSVTALAQKVLVLLLADRILSEEDPGYIDFEIPGNPNVRLEQIRQVLMERFDILELRLLGYLHFSEAYFLMPRWTTRIELVDLLIDYCRKEEKIPNLIDVIIKYRSGSESQLMQLTAKDDNNKALSIKRYSRTKLREMLLAGFTDYELRGLTVHNSAFLELNLPASQYTSSELLVIEIISYAERVGKIEDLLMWARDDNPYQFSKYFESDTLIVNATEDEIASQRENDPNLVDSNMRERKVYSRNILPIYLGKVLAKYFRRQDIIDMFFEYCPEFAQEIEGSQGYLNTYILNILRYVRENRKWVELVSAVKAFRPFLLKEIKIAPPFRNEFAVYRDILQRFPEEEFFYIARELNIPRDVQEIYYRLGSRICAREMITHISQHNKLEYLQVLIARFAPAWSKVSVYTALEDLFRKQYEKDALHILSFDLNVMNFSFSDDKSLVINYLLEEFASGLDSDLDLLINAAFHPNSFKGVRPAAILRRVIQRSSIINTPVLDDVIFEFKAVNEIPRLAPFSVKLTMLIDWSERRSLLGQLAILFSEKQTSLGQKVFSEMVRFLPELVDYILNDLDKSKNENENLISVKVRQRLFSELSIPELSILFNILAKSELS